MSADTYRDVTSGEAQACQAAETRRTSAVNVLAVDVRYDVIRPLADGVTYALLGRNLSAADAAELHAFHKPMDRKYAGAVTIRPAKPTCKDYLQVRCGDAPGFASLASATSDASQ